MRKPKQLALFAPTGRSPSSRPLSHGGDLGKGREKGRRPFSPRRPLHIVMRSSRARGPWSLLRPPESRRRGRPLAALVATERTCASINSPMSAITSTLLARCRERRALQTFLRAFAGLIARAVTGAEQGRPVGKFWDTLAYSRVMTWGREYRGVRAYILNNEMEAGGLPTVARDASRRSLAKALGPRRSVTRYRPLRVTPLLIGVPRTRFHSAPSSRESYVLDWLHRAATLHALVGTKLF